MQKTFFLRFANLLIACATAASLSSCDKLWEISQKLKAPEEPETQEIVEKIAPPPPEPEVVEIVPPAPPEPEGPKIDPEIEVSILGYHDFANQDSRNNMVINTSKFRAQMEALKKAEIPVIPMMDYVAWKKGEKNIPNPSVVITIDDGWEAVYTHAFPILREYGYPFSVYLYKNYIGGAGRSLSYEQINEMIANGCEIGVHSVSHSDMSRTGGRSATAYEEWLREELGESLRFLREKFGDSVIPVFAYPYGKYNKQVVTLAEEYGYELGVTVAPKKAAHSLPDFEVGRYIIHGDNNTNIGYAMNFKSNQVTPGGALTSPTATEGGEEEAPLVTMWPKQNEDIVTRTPNIQVNLSKLSGVSTSGMSMTVSGLGKVPYDYDAANGVVTYQVIEPIRSTTCQVTLVFKRRGESKSDVIKWGFNLDRTALYLQEPVVAQPIEVSTENEGDADGNSAALSGEGEPVS
ncbi:MAG: polysaccharide deacetylase family protein [Verrucomicrobiota bacterium]